MRDRTIRILSGVLGLITIGLFILLLILFVPDDSGKVWFIVVLFGYTAVRSEKLWRIVYSVLKDKEEVDPLDVLDIDEEYVVEEPEEET